MQIKPLRAVRAGASLLAACATLYLSPDAHSTLPPTWSLQFDGTSLPNDAFLASPAIAADGTVYIAGGFADSGHSNERRLYAINGSTGAILSGWPVYLGSRITAGNGILDDKGIESTAAIGPDGMLYIGSWNTNVFKINPSTRAITTWTPNVANSEPRGILRSSPIVANGYLYCWMSGDPAATTPHPHLVILNASTMTYVGEWFDNGVYGEAIASPALGADQKIYVCTHYLSGPPNNEFSGRVYAIDVSNPASPSKLWEYPTGCVGPIIAAPVIGADGRVYVSTQPGNMSGVNHAPVLICFDPSSATPQTPLWTCTTGGLRSIDAAPSMGRNGEIYVSNDLGQFGSTSLSAMNPMNQVDGNDYVNDWDFGTSTTEKFDSSPAITADNLVFAKTLDETPPHPAILYKIDKDGAFLDQASIGNDTQAWHADPVWTSGVISGGGMSSVMSSPAIAPNGQLILATAGGDTSTSVGVVGTPTGAGGIYCFATGSSTQSFWPNFRGNAQNTGNAQDNKWTTNATPSLSITALVSPFYQDVPQAYAVNNFGTAVGYRTYPSSPSSYYGACYWSTTPNPSGNSPNSMSEVYPGDTSFAYGISDANQIVGIEQYSGVWRGVLWSSLGPSIVPTLLPLPTGFSSSSDAYQVCVSWLGSKQLAVGDAVNGSALHHAMQWDASSPSSAGVDLGTLALPTVNAHSYAYGVNSRDWVVGKSQTASGGIYCAFAMSNDNSPLKIDPSTDNLSGTDAAVATAINGLGQIVGGSKNGATVEHAWIWQINFANAGARATTKKDLGTIGTGTSRASAINNRGQVVGFYSGGAFIWLPGWTSIKNLRSLLSSTDAAAWSSLSDAVGITDDGCVVGYGYKTGSSYSVGYAIRIKP